MQPILKFHHLLKSLDPSLDFKAYEDQIHTVLQNDIIERIAPFKNPYCDFDSTLESIEDYQSKLKYIQKLAKLDDVVRRLKDVDLSTLALPNEFYASKKLQLKTIDRVSFVIKALDSIRRTKSVNDISADPYKIFSNTYWKKLDGHPEFDKLMNDVMYQSDKTEKILAYYKDYWFTYEDIDGLIKEIDVKRTKIEYEMRVKEQRAYMLFRMILPSLLILGIFTTGFHFLTQYINQNWSSFANPDVFSYLVISVLSLVVMYLLILIFPRIFSLFEEEDSIGYVFQVGVILLFSGVIMLYHFLSNNYLKDYYIQYSILLLFTTLLSYGIKNSELSEELLGMTNAMSRTCFAIIMLGVTATLMYVFRDTPLYVNITLGVNIILTAGLAFREEIRYMF